MTCRWRHTWSEWTPTYDSRKGWRECLKCTVVQWQIPNLSKPWRLPRWVTRWLR